ncbi:rhodanese-like domain-containing protein [Endothiovibrio diazotrophicus]
MEKLPEFAVNHWELVLALVVTLAFLLNNLFGARLRGYHQVGPAEATGLINHQDAVVLDVREEREFQGGHILNAIHIPVGKLAGRIDELAAHKGRPVVAVCRSGHRSASACAVLRKHGFEQVYNLGGGVLAWSNANLPLTKKKSK